MKTLQIGPALTVEQVAEVARAPQGTLRIVLSADAKARMQVSHDFLMAQIATGQTFYGINTGFGHLSNVRIADNQIETLQYNLLRSHACGMGPSLSDELVRAMLLLRASNLAIGHSGVSIQLVEQILHLLNHHIIPIIPEQGSVGASGDLAPLSHLALVLIGEGRARYQGQERSGKEALAAAGLTPVVLGPKEGLALINGTQFMTALGVLNLLEAERLCDVADTVGAMSLEAMRGTTDPFDARIHAVRPHPGQAQTATHLRALLRPAGERSEISQSHQNCTRVQDPYSSRCMPQVHGASRDALAFVRQVLEREIHSVTDNPLIFAPGLNEESGKILSGGNFHGQIVAIAMDVLAIAVAELGSISEQRFSKMMNPNMSLLPTFLTQQAGLNSGFMIVHVAAASIVSENKTLCHPASVDSIPTNADKEDHVSMGAWGARKAAQVVGNTKKVLSLELLAAAQGIDLLRPLKSSLPLEKVHALIRSKIEPYHTDRAWSDDYVLLAQLMDSPEFEKMCRVST